MRKRWLIAGGLGLLVAGVAVVVVARGASKPNDGRADAAAKVAPPLQFKSAEVVVPLRVEMPELIEFSGPLVAPRTAVVRAKAAGTLVALEVAEGSRVQAGQVLGAIDVADLRSRVAEREAMVESARARLGEAQRTHAANEDLARQQFISPNALESSKAALEAARAQLKSNQAQLDTAGIGLREARLTAPIAGVVGKRNVLPGEKVSTEQELLTVVDLQQLELAGVIGTHQVSKLAVGQAVEVRAEGLDEPVTGRIDRIAPSAVAGTRGIPVVVRLANPNELLRAGQYASASVALPDAALRLTVPLSALSQASGQEFLWTIEKGVLVRRIVVTGRRQLAQGRVEVLQGLPEGAAVIAARFDNLKEGAAARVVGQQQAQPAAMPLAEASQAPVATRER
jgi:RND family efflux transporter MFP subunit